MQCSQTKTTMGEKQGAVDVPSSPTNSENLELPVLCMSPILSFAVPDSLSDSLPSTSHDLGSHADRRARGSGLPLLDR